MPPKKGKARESMSASPAVQNIRAAILASDRVSKRSLRSEEESVEEREEDSEAEGGEIEKEIEKEIQISNNELADLMNKLNQRFSSLEDQIGSLDTKVNSFGEQMVQSDKKVESLTSTLTELAARVDSVEASGTSAEESLISIRADLDKVMLIQANFEEKYLEILRLAQSLKERDEVIDFQQIEIDCLKEFKEATLDKDEIREQYFRKMNLWVYGLEEPTNENTWETIKTFGVDVLGLERVALDSWTIKNAHRVGDPTKNKRPIIIAFVRWEDRLTFLRKSGVLYQYNKDHDSTYSIKTDLAPRARQRRKDYHAIKDMIKDEEKCMARVRDNPKGDVWIQKKFEVHHKWINLKVIEQKYWDKLAELRAKQLADSRAKQVSS